MVSEGILSCWGATDVQERRLLDCVVCWWFQDPTFPSRTFHCNKTISVIHYIVSGQKRKQLTVKQDKILMEVFLFIQS